MTVRQKPESNQGRPSRAPVFLSAFVFPGAGQLVQRRWAAAVFFGAGFIVTFIIFVVYMARIIGSYYAIAFADDAGRPPDVPLTQARVTFALAMMVYAAGVIDAHRAYRTSGRQWAGRHLGEPEKGGRTS